MADPILEDRSREIEAIRMEDFAHRSRASQLEMILHVYMVLGALMAVSALGYFGFSFLNISLTTEQRLSLMIAGAGVLVAALSWVILTNRRKRAEGRAQALRVAERDYDLVSEWSAFEAMGRRVLQEEGIEFNTRSPRSILSALESNGLIPSEMARDISMALDIRNKLVHDINPVPNAMIRAAGSILAESNEKLSSILRADDPLATYDMAGSSIIGASTAYQVYGGGEPAPTESSTINLLGGGKRKLNLNRDEE